MGLFVRGLTVALSFARHLFKTGANVRHQPADTLIIIGCRSLKVMLTVCSKINSQILRVEAPGRQGAKTQVISGILRVFAT